MPGGRCHPCVRYKLSPMSRAAQIKLMSLKEALRGHSCLERLLPDRSERVLCFRSETAGYRGAPPRRKRDDGLPSEVISPDGARGFRRRRRRSPSSSRRQARWRNNSRGRTSLRRRCPSPQMWTSRSVKALLLCGFDLCRSSELVRNELWHRRLSIRPRRHNDDRRV